MGKAPSCLCTCTTVIRHSWTHRPPAADRIRSALSPSHHNSLAVRNPPSRCPGHKVPPHGPWAYFFATSNPPIGVGSPIRTGGKDCSTTYSHALAKGYEDPSSWLTLLQNKAIMCGSPCCSAHGSTARRHTREGGGWPASGVARRPPFQRSSHHS